MSSTDGLLFHWCRTLLGFSWYTGSGAQNFIKVCLLVSGLWESLPPNVIYFTIYGVLSYVGHSNSLHDTPLLSVRQRGVGKRWRCVRSLSFVMSHSFEWNCEVSVKDSFPTSYSHACAHEQIDPHTCQWKVEKYEKLQHIWETQVGLQDKIKQLSLRTWCGGVSECHINGPCCVLKCHVAQPRRSVALWVIQCNGLSRVLRWHQSPLSPPLLSLVLF